MGCWTLRVRGEGCEGFVGYAHNAPLGQHVGAELLVESESRGVPGEDVPLEARAAFSDRDLGQVFEQGSSDSLPSVGGGDVKVFKAESMVAAPGAVAGEEEGEAGGSSVKVSDYATEAWNRTEAVAEQVGFGGEDSIRFALVQGKLADEAQDGRNILWGGGADVQRGAQLGCSGFSGGSDLPDLSLGSGGGAGFLAAGLGWASSHLSKGRVKAKSSCFLPLGSV